MDFDVHIQQQLAELERATLLRTPRAVQGRHGPVMVVDGRPAIGLCSNNSLGLADDPRLVEATVDSLALGSAPARVASPYLRHERLAPQPSIAWRVSFAMPAALLFSTGYAANLGAIQALCIPATSVQRRPQPREPIDGCRLSRAEFTCTATSISTTSAALLHAAPRSRTRRAGSDRVGVFDGRRLRAACRAARVVRSPRVRAAMVDDAHALGVLGPHGRGLCAREGVVPDLLVGTLSKAFGCSGGFVAGSAAVVSLIENRARSYVFSTAPFPALAATAVAATDAVERADDRRALRARPRATPALRLAGAWLSDRGGRSADHPCRVGPRRRRWRSLRPCSSAACSCMAFVRRRFLPGTSRLRVTPMATHSAAQIEQALVAFEACKNRL